MASVTDWTGVTLSGGRYRVTGPLDEGGMAFVYRARDEKSGGEVVVKVPQSETLKVPGAAARFIRELHTQRRLAHPHIVKILDVGLHNNLPYVVMELLTGGTLRDRQPRGPRGEPLALPPREVAAWLPAVASALDFMHARRHIHRDVKPSNILFDAQGKPYLSDFGLVKVLADEAGAEATALTGVGKALGTPQYMAPEVLMGRHFDGRADQYSLGVVVYEVLSGRCPFAGATVAQIFEKHARQPPRPLCDVNPALSRPLADAVSRALAKDPAGRYPDCASFARAVIEAVGRPAVAAPRGAPASGRQGAARPGPHGPAQPPGKCRSRLPWVLGGAAAVALAVVVVLLLNSGKDSRPEPAKPEVRGAALGNPTGQPGAKEQKADTSPPKVKELPSKDKDPLPKGKELPKDKKLPKDKDPPKGKQQPPKDVESAQTKPPPKDPPPPPKDKPPAAKDKELPPKDKPAVEVVRFPDRWPVALSADGKLLLFAGNAPGDKTLPAGARTEMRLTDFATAEELRTFGGGDDVEALAFSPDGTRAASGSRERTVRLWNAGTGRELRALPIGAGAACLAFAPDGERLAAGGADGIIYLWDLKKGNEARRLEGHRGMVLAVAWTPDGLGLVSGGRDGSVRLWDAANGRLTRRLRAKGGEVLAVAVSPDGKQALTGGAAEHGADPSAAYAVRLWDLSTGEEVQRLVGHTGAVKAVAFAAGGAQALSGGDRTVRLWELSSGREVLMREFPAAVERAAFTADGFYVLGVSRDGTLRRIELPN